MGKRVNCPSLCGKSPGHHGGKDAQQTQVLKSTHSKCHMLTRMCTCWPPPWGPGKEVLRTQARGWHRAGKEGSSGSTWAYMPSGFTFHSKCVLLQNQDLIKNISKYSRSISTLLRARPRVQKRGLPGTTLMPAYATYYVLPNQGTMQTMVRPGL